MKSVQLNYTQLLLVEHLRPVFFLLCVFFFSFFGLGAIKPLIASGSSADEYPTHYSSRSDSLLRV